MSTIENELLGPSKLKRSLTLLPTTLYGLGVTIGAGIYVLIGAMAGQAGTYAPLAFVGAAIVMSFTAASFAELGSRIPVSASEAAYVEAAFRSKAFSLLAGLLVVATSVVSAAAISSGSVGYIRVFVDLPPALIIAGVVVAMGAIAAWGIEESVTLAGIMTFIEIGGLLIIVAAGFWSDGAAIAHLQNAVTLPSDRSSWLGLWSASQLAIFAFIGFEGIVNIGEEVREPRRTVPRAIFLALAVSAAIYVAVCHVAIAAVGADALARSSAPLAVTFQRLTGWHPALMSGIAIIAILNGVIVQLIMASRVIYGLASQNRLPAAFAAVSPATRTPLLATVSALAIALGLALLAPLERLADLTSHVVLVLYALINLSLARIKAREPYPPEGVFVTRRFVPVFGFVACVAVLAFDAYRRFV